jgi:hypothetical protein
MSGGNFNWFLHTVLFMHTIYIIEKQKAKGSDMGDDEESEDEADVDIE